MSTAPRVEALLFDVLGTVVDWRSPIVAAGDAISAVHGVELDWSAFAVRWRREAYIEPSLRMIDGDLPWAPLDEALRGGLDRLAAELGFADAPGAELEALATAWDRGAPWPDVRRGLERLRGRFPIAPLSNAALASLVRLSRNGDLRWDCIISTEIFRTYKPDPQAYLGAARLLRLPPETVVLVSSHLPDLRGASAGGLRTAYVERAGEGDPGGEPHSDRVDFAAGDFLELAAMLGC